MRKSEPIDFSLILASSIHDMKNSLNMLLNSLDDMYGNKKPKNDEEAKSLAILHYEASRVNNDLIQLLGLYRIENNQLPLITDEHFVHDLLEEQVVRNHVLLESKDIEHNIKCDDALAWYFDHDLLAGSLNNILVNAIRYTKDKVELCAEQINGKLVISIHDNGPGYPSLMLEDPANHMRGIDFHSGSTSLGLYFASEVAHLHKKENHTEGSEQNKHSVGTIHLENGGNLGGGVFQIILP